MNYTSCMALVQVLTQVLAHDLTVGYEACQAGGMLLRCLSAILHTVDMWRLQADADESSHVAAFEAFDRQGFSFSLRGQRASGLMWTLGGSPGVLVVVVEVKVEVGAGAEAEVDIEIEAAVVT